MTSADQIIQKVIDLLSRRSGVAALVLAGSRVPGNAFPADEFSDIELYVVAQDSQFEEVTRDVQSIQDQMDGVVLAYRNQWSGWSVLFKSLLRLELPVVKASDESVFSRSESQKIKILYQQAGFSLLQVPVPQPPLPPASIEDFWYMAVYTAQHIARGELWLARDALRVGMQSNVRRLLLETYHPDQMALDRDRRIEMTWGPVELKILKDTSCSYDRVDIVRAFRANIDAISSLVQSKPELLKQFKQYYDSLLPEISKLVISS